MLRRILSILTASVLIYSCTPSDKYPIQKDVWVPIYGATSELKSFKVLGPQDLITSGKIYAYNQYLFQVDVQKGIHMYEIVNKEPIKRHFLQIYGAQEISIKDGILYTNNYEDLVGINITQPDNMTIVSRTADVFPLGGNMNRPPESGYFQCVDTSKGIVIGWKLEHDLEANCKY